MSAKATLEGFYAAMSTGDVPGAVALMDADVVWVEAEGFVYSGTYRGPDAVVAGVFAQIGADWDGFAAVPDYVVAEVTVRSRSGPTVAPTRRPARPSPPATPIRSRRATASSSTSSRSWIQPRLTSRSNVGGVASREAGGGERHSGPQAGVEHHATARGSVRVLGASRRLALGLADDSQPRAR
jgi:SnoaL-like domain